MTDYHRLAQELVNKYFKELKNVNIKIKPLRILKQASMITSPFTNKIYYNKDALKKCSGKALKGLLAHELYHFIQFRRLNFFQRLFFIPMYHLVEDRRINHEVEDHMELINRGLSEELLALNNFVRKRHSKQLWDNKLSKYYLSDEKIRKIVKYRNQKR